tara:strand:+ start:6520 stop:7638 length:1119 start_codon:yes stop_codon:yes gene_type:complete
MEDNKNDFDTIVVDFAKDLVNTFPELNSSLNDLANGNKNTIEETKNYCKKVYPEKFFDILYENEEMFKNNDTLFLLPNVDFKTLWYENITDSTRNTIWKYLQLILLTNVPELSDQQSFGDTAKLFEAIDKDEFRSKLESTIDQMGDFFDTSSNNFSNEIPNAEKVHEHVSNMMNGKLGNLAKDISEETAADLSLNIQDEKSLDGVFKQLLKDPKKLMGLVENVGNKLEQKIKSGQVKESELIEEATEIMKNMKNMPGMENFQNMFSKMGVNSNQKMNMSAMQSQLNKNLQNAKNKERMQEKLKSKEKKKDQYIDYSDAIEESNKIAAQLLKSEGFDEDGIEKLIFSTGEKYEKSSKETPSNKKKKKRKKNKN